MNLSSGSARLCSRAHWWPMCHGDCGAAHYSSHRAEGNHWVTSVLFRSLSWFHLIIYIIIIIQQRLNRLVFFLRALLLSAPLRDSPTLLNTTYRLQCVYMIQYLTHIFHYIRLATQWIQQTNRLRAPEVRWFRSKHLRVRFKKVHRLVKWERLCVVKQKCQISISDILYITDLPFIDHKWRTCWWWLWKETI